MTTSLHLIDLLPTYLLYVAQCAANIATKPVNVCAPHESALFELAVADTKLHVGNAAVFFEERGFDADQITTDVICELAACLSQRGLSNFADIEHCAEQFKNGLVSLAEFVLYVQCSKLQLHFLKQHIALPTKIYTKVNLSDWDEAVADVMDRSRL